MAKHSKILTTFLVFSFVFVLAGIAQQQEKDTVVCPMCSKEMKKSEAKVTYDYKGKMYYFCCEKCKEEFMKKLEKFSHEKAEMKVIYTCPIHPEVKADKPGKCPKCDMELKKKMVDKEHMHAHIYKTKKDVKEDVYIYKIKKEVKEECFPMMDLMGSKDVEMKVENIDDGVTVKITSKDAEIVKKLQGMAAKMKIMCEQKEKSCEKEAKKEEAKK